MHSQGLSFQQRNQGHHVILDGVPGASRRPGPVPGLDQEGCPLAVCTMVARSIGTQIFVDEKTVNGDIFLLRKNVKIFLLKLSSVLCCNNVKGNAEMENDILN